jgi:hypothetical protein
MAELLRFIYPAPSNQHPRLPSGGQAASLRLNQWDMILIPAAAGSV